MAHGWRTIWQTSRLGGRGARSSWLGAAAAGVAMVGFVGSDDRDDRSRARAAQSPVATAPIRCDGTRNAVSDPLNDVQWSPSGIDDPIDQDAVGGDVRRASLRIAGQTACVTLRLREPVPARLDVDVEFEQETSHRYTVSNTLGISVNDGHVLGETPRSEGEPRHYVKVHASVTGDLLRIRFPTRPATKARVNLGRPLTWRLWTTQRPPSDTGSWWTDDVGPEQAPARGPAKD